MLICVNKNDCITHNNKYHKNKIYKYKKIN